MSQISREATLRKIASPLGAEDKRVLRAPLHDGVDKLSWEELGFVIEGLAFAQRPIRAAARQVIQRNGLGPRGAFILSMISGGLCYPLELSTALKVGRSLITAEVSRLIEAGLVTASPGKEDRRRSQLELTEAGDAACAEVRAAMSNIVRRNLAGYTADEVRLLGQMLRDVRRLDGEEDEDALAPADAANRA